jgi:hypothetical protein
VARRNEIVDEFEKSGLSGVKFAELAGVKYQTLATWVKKRRGHPGATSAAKAAPMRWLETVVDSAVGTSGTLVVHLPSGARLELTDEKQAVLAAALIRNLGQAC